ncbi:hypothetical protein BLOT_010017 [Blomia tropicalis]|nr:hypothetical protein BLOT_010017 [Blomia tropicalis]
MLEDSHNGTFNFKSNLNAWAQRMGLSSATKDDRPATTLLVPTLFQLDQIFKIPAELQFWYTITHPNFPFHSKPFMRY